MDKLLSTSDLAGILGMSRQSLINARSSGNNQIKYIKIGNKVRYQTSDVSAYLKSNSYINTKTKI